LTVDQNSAEFGKEKLDYASLDHALTMLSVD